MVLSWQQGSIPPAIADQYTLTDWREVPLAPSDGNTLYGCALAHQAGATPTTTASLAPQVWVTHDRAAHWEQVGTLPITRSDISLCYLTVDMLDPATVIAVVAWSPVGNHPTPGQSASFITFTGGQTWAPFSYVWNTAITQLATTNGTTYALVDSIDPAAPHLVASTDGLHTWHSIDHAISATGQKVLALIVYPGTRAILAQVGRDGVPTRQLWSSPDGGTTWRAVNGPTVEQYAITAGTSLAQDALCAGYYDGAQAATAPNQLFCSTDGGAQWSERPGLNLRASVAVGPASAGEVGPVQIVGVATDGSVLALDNGTSTPQLYRLPAGAAQWQPLGGLPLAERMVVFYFSSSGPGILRAFSIGSEPAASASGATVFTAVYP